MPHEATDEDYTNSDNLNLMKLFIAENAENWYRYALQLGYAVNRHSLYLVSGCMKSKAWGVATFCGKATSRHKNTPVIGQSYHTDDPAYIWKRSGMGGKCRTGPLPRDPGILDTETRLPDRENQCLFLRGFKISLSETAWQDIHPLSVMSTNKSKLSADSKSSEKSSDSSGSTQHANNTASQEYKNSMFNLYQKRITGATKLKPNKLELFHPLNVINETTSSQLHIAYY
ncbi:hypothetical protein BDQ17DRAFT_1436010 [Cyathus striatus]|nr:hypothetical protein BDQ17DRAFT_1436010 [Cyathus striatus]